MTPVTIDSGATISWSVNRSGRCGPFEYGGNLYGVFVDAVTSPTSPNVEMWKSTDSGATWSEVGAGSHPTITGSSGYHVVDAVMVGTSIHVACIANTNAWQVVPFNLSTDSWGAATSGTGPTALAIPTISNTAQGFLSVRSDGVYVIVHNAAVEKVMGVNYRRVDYSRYASGSWTNNVAVGGYTIGGDFDARMITVDASNRVYLFYSSVVGSTPTMWARTLDTGGSLGSGTTISTNDGVPYFAGHAGYVADTGRVVFLHRNGTTDFSLAYAVAGATPSWFDASVSTTTVEQDNCNTGSLAIDGSTIYVFWADDATQDLWRDEGTTASGFGTDVEFQDAATVNGVSIGKITNAIGVFYLDGSTVKYDAYALAPPATPHNVSDTGAFGSTEVAVIFVSVAASETGVFASTESAAFYGTMSVADAGALGSSESAALALDIVLGDSGALGAIESLTTAWLIDVADTGAFGVTDSASILAAIAASDTAAIGSSETSTVDAEISTSDTGAVGSTESSTLFATIGLADSGTLDSTESLAAAITAALIDSGAIASAEDVSIEISASGPIEHNVADTGAFGVIESTAVSMTVSVSDTGSISAAESMASAIAIALADAGAIGSIEVTQTFVDMNVDDFGALVFTLSVLVGAPVTIVLGGVMRTFGDPSITVTRSPGQVAIAVARSVNPATIMVERTGGQLDIASIRQYITLSMSVGRDVGGLDIAVSRQGDG